MRTVAIIQARMGSTRLPGKVMKLLSGEPMIRHVVDRVRRASSIDEVVVATSDLESDDLLAEYLSGVDVPVFRGPEQDVLGRYHGAASEYRADVVVRVTSDCPLISPGVTESVVQAFLRERGQLDYASNTLVRTYPRGLDTEVFSFEALDRAFRAASHGPDREHVTLYIWRRPDAFRLKSVTDVQDKSTLRWTVDTPEDFAFATAVYDALYTEHPTFEYEDVLGLLERRPELTALNAHVEQKHV